VSRLLRGFKGLWQRPAALPVLAAVLTVLGLLPVLMQSFGFIDDYSVLYRKQTDPGPTLDAALVQGRPIAGLLQGAAFAVVNDIDGLVLLRGFSVVCLAAFAGLLVRGLVQQGWSRAVSLALAGLGLVLPSTAAMAAWAILLMGPAALLLGLLAALSAGRGLDRVREQGLRSRCAWSALVVPFLLLSGGLLAYQPSAMVFWPIALLILLAPVRRAWTAADQVRGGVALLMVGGAASVAGYLGVKLGVWYVGGDAPRTALVTDVAGKLQYTLTQAAPRVFDPLSLTPRPAVAAATAVLVCALLLAAPWGPAHRRALVLLLWVSAGVLSYLPSLATGENWASARSLAAAFFVPPVALALTAQAFLETPHGRRSGVRVAAALGAGVVVLSSAVFSVWHLHAYWAGPQAQELKLARQALAPEVVELADLDVAVIRSDFTQSLAPGFSYDEAGVPSTYAAWVPVPLTQLIAREETGHWLPSVAAVEREDADLLPPGTVVIDYGAMLDPTSSVPVVTR
jgi:hypothetical protein